MVKSSVFEWFKPFENRISKRSELGWRSVFQVRFSSPHCSPCKRISVKTFFNVFSSVNTLIKSCFFCKSVNTFVRSHVSVEQTLSEVGLVAGHALEGPGPDALVLPGVVH